MPPTARDLILVICAVSLVGLGVATFVNVHRTRELTQATYDEARAVKVSTKAIEDHADAIRKDVHPHEPERALGLSAFIYRCSTSAMLASCELTNPGPKIAVACWTGFVQRKGSSDRTESVAVCTGDVKPRATVSITADYLVGAARRLCPGGPYGGVNWDDCNFDVIDSTNKLAPKGDKSGGKSDKTDATDL